MVIEANKTSNNIQVVFLFLISRTERQRTKQKERVKVIHNSKMKRLAIKTWLRFTFKKNYLRVACCLPQLLNIENQITNIHDDDPNPTSLHLEN